MKIKAILPLALSMIYLMMISQPLLADQDKQKAAIEAAEAWLSLVDEGLYIKSWREGATYFKNAVSQEQWMQSMVAYRKPLGKILSRNLTSAQYTTTLPATSVVMKICGWKSVQMFMRYDKVADEDILQANVVGIAYVEGKSSGIPLTGKIVTASDS